MTESSAPRLTLPDPAVAQAGLMLDRARWAAQEFRQIGSEAVGRIVAAVAEAAHANAQKYAEWAVRETGYGVVEHKRQKNEACSRGLIERYKGQDFVKPRIDAASKTVALPRPAGVLLALLPVTNPVATLYFKTLLALMTRNAIVISPHPGARTCCADAARMLAKVASDAGAPDGAIQILSDPNIPLVEMLMRDRRVDLIVATGGPAVVRAAYSSGNPAIGVGPGNAPAVVDESADAKAAAERIVGSKSFDNSILCTNESAVIAVGKAADPLLAAMRAARAHVCSEEETEKLRQVLFPEGRFNLDALGKDAPIIAGMAGFQAPGARILVAPVASVRPEELLAREKLCPVLAFTRAGDFDEAIALSRLMMRDNGRGHSAAIHSNVEEHILRFAAAVPALRTVVNVGCSLGAAGYESHLGPSMTIGTGFAGGSSLAENLGPQHLLQIARIAYGSAVAVPFGNFEGLDPNDLTSAPLHAAQSDALLPATEIRNDNALRVELRQIILEELNALLAA